ncbi:hypothetical protein JYB87_07410 [Shewanella avicenniae]|uniref:Uncharacterized protein n=1 Tax=Shewanella avicenniae TaxID=2814294 RepID=A0ABX7QW25_9GAMM|nr:hypothetical protein [Shewanella avicenniae]QSX35038.1 hypothetical protein JYB87_07410 [Shewanella avicenniae]
MLKAGDRVKLITFNGEASPPEDCEPEENYWLLVGEHATVIEPETIYGRALIEFEVLVTSKGLYCHNEIPNTLLILESDLLRV